MTNSDSRFTLIVLSSDRSAVFLEPGVTEFGAAESGRDEQNENLLPVRANTYWSTVATRSDNVFEVSRAGAVDEEVKGACAD